MAAQSTRPRGCVDWPAKEDGLSPTNRNDAIWYVVKAMKGVRLRRAPFVDSH